MGFKPTWCSTNSLKDPFVTFNDENYSIYFFAQTDNGLYS